MGRCVRGAGPAPSLTASQMGKERWGLPMGPGRLVEEPGKGPGPLSSIPCPFFTSFTHFLQAPWKSLAFVTSKSWILVQSKATRIRGFSEEGWDQESQQVPVPLCTALLLGTTGAGVIPHLPLWEQVLLTTHWTWTPRREGGSYTCDTPGVSANAP